MANKWITFVKAYANDKGCSYSEALKDPSCKALYKKGGGFWKDFAKGFTSVLDVATKPLSIFIPPVGLATGALSKGVKAIAGQGVKRKKGGAVNPRWWEDPSIPPTNPLDIKGMIEYNKRNPEYAKAWEENWKTMKKAKGYEDMMG